MALKKTINIDPQLLRQAREACGAATDTQAVRMGLEQLVQRAAAVRLMSFCGSEPNAQDVPRLRESQP